MTTLSPAHLESAPSRDASAARIFLLIGPPGCGKGTQSRGMSERFGVPCISTGDILRSAAGSDTPIGRRVREIMTSGALVEDELVNELVADRTAARDCAPGFILDGYPRTALQADYLSGLLRSRGLGQPKVVVFDVHPDELVSRLEARRYCPVCGRVYNMVSAPPAQSDHCDDDGMFLARRADDHAEVIRERLRAYETSTAPLLRYYSRSGLVRIDAGKDSEAVAAQIEAALLGARV